MGAFKENKLVGFVLHGLREIDNKQIIYNGGTGVIPSERGQGLTYKMYNFMLPQLRNLGVSEVMLEVIANNVPAIKVYEKLGFKNLRTLNCYKGDINLKNLNASIKIVPIENPDWLALSKYGEVQPTWQNSQETINNASGSMQILGAYQNSQLIGYLIYNRSNNRIIQLAVDKEYRRRKIGSSLLHSLKGSPCSIINVDAKSAVTNKFLEYSGLENFLQQNEMCLTMKAIRS